jgi:tRNA(adenine34) deaminase
MNNFNMSWMKEALFLAERAAAEGEVPVGAILVKEGVIVSRGSNKREEFQNPIAHAEMIAIQEAAKVTGSWRLIDCILVVTLEPCLMCLAAAQQARISKIIYAAQDKKGGAISLGYRFNEDLRINHRFPVENVEMVECGQILTDFFAKRRIESNKNDPAE